MKHYLIVVECAIEFNGKLLIIRRPEGKHAGGLLSFAGGKVDADDEMHDFDILRAATKREIFEELGLKLDENLQYVTSEFFIDNSGTHVIANIFHVKYDYLPTIVPCEREVPWHGWMTADEINSRENSPEWLKRHVATILSHSTILTQSSC
jgi:8-oxo-dGTP diphosphatase